MEVLLELLIIEIIFLQSKFTQSAQLLDVFFKSVQWAGVGWYVADSAFLLPELSLATTALSAFLQSLRKRICRDRDRQIQVIFFVELSFTNFTWQDTTDTVSSVIEKYLKAPLEEFKCLRCFEF